MSSNNYTLLSDKTLPERNYVNRTRKEENINRKKITILGQNANIMDAKIEDVPFVLGETEGTPINASIIEKFHDVIEQADTNAKNAFRTADTAINDANTALSNSNTALSKSETAIVTANEAKEKALQVEQNLADRGTTIRINSVAQSELNFISEPQSQIDSKLNKNFSLLSEKTSLDANDLFVLQDSTSSSTIKENKKITLSSFKSYLIDLIYPVGSIYLTISSVEPETLFGGEWKQVSQGRALFGQGELNKISYIADKPVDAGLPDIKGQTGGKVGTNGNENGTNNGAFTFAGNDPNSNWGGNNSWNNSYYVNFEASKGEVHNGEYKNLIYGNSETVQPNAYVVYVFKRIN